MSQSRRRAFASRSLPPGTIVKEGEDVYVKCPVEACDSVFSSTGMNGEQEVAGMLEAHVAKAHPHVASSRPRRGAFLHAQLRLAYAEHGSPVLLHSSPRPSSSESEADAASVGSGSSPVAVPARAPSSRAGALPSRRSRSASRVGSRVRSVAARRGPSEPPPSPQRDDDGAHADSPPPPVVESEEERLVREHEQDPIRGWRVAPRGSVKRFREVLLQALLVLLREVASTNSSLAWRRLLHIWSALPPARARPATISALLHSVVETGSLPSRPPDPGGTWFVLGARRGEDRDVQRRAAAETLASLGRLSDAKRALESGGLAQLDVNTLQALHALHPAAPEPVPDFAASIRDVSAPELSVEMVRKVLLEQKRGVAAGPSGLSGDHLKVLLGSERGLRDLTDVLQHIVRGRVPREVVPWLTTSRLIPLMKASGGVRPVAVGEVLLRLAARCSLAVVKPQLVEYLGEGYLQVGAGIPGGSESQLLRIESALEGDPDSVVVALDLSNAFNSVSRTEMLRQVQIHAGPLLPQVAMSYGESSDLLVDSPGGATIIKSQQGVRQGDAFGPFLFALAIHSVLMAARGIAEANGAIIGAYLDDICVAGPSSAVVLVVHELQQQLERLQLIVNRSKSSVWSLSMGVKRDVASQLGMAVADGGVMILGVPFGCDQFVQEVSVLTVRRLLSILSELKLLSNRFLSFLLLRWCVASSATSLLRGVRADLSHEAAREWDKGIGDALVQLLQLDEESELTSRAMKWSELPIKMGGLGVRPARSVRLAAALGMVFDHRRAPYSKSGMSKRVTAAVAEMKEWIVGAVDSGATESDGLSELNKMVEDLDGSVGDSDERSAEVVLEDVRGQKKLTALMDRIWLWHVWRSESDERLREHRLSTIDREVVKELGVGFAKLKEDDVMCIGGEYLSHVPEGNGMVLSDEDFLRAIRFRMGVDFGGEDGRGRCRCSHSSDEHSVAKCPGRSAGRIQGHDLLSQCLRAMCASAGQTAVLEPTGALPDPNRRPDIAVYHSTGMTELVDVRTVNNHQMERTPLSLGQYGWRAQVEKRSRYRAMATRTTTFIPFVVEFNGVIMSGGANFLRSLAGRAVAKGWRAEEFSEHWRYRLSVTLARLAARSLEPPMPEVRSRYVRKSRAVRGLQAMMERDE